MPEALNPCSRCNGSGTEPEQPAMAEITRLHARGDCLARAHDRCSDIIPCGLDGAQRSRLTDVLAQAWDDGCRYGAGITADSVAAIKNPENGVPDLMAATCTWCEEPMDGRPCIGKPLTETAVVEGVSYYRIPWGPPPDLHDDREFLGGTSPEQLASIRERWATWPEGFAANCRDCATPQGGLHHPGCDTERCPRCLGQAISCGCKWESDTIDPDEPEGDPFWRRTPEPESPYAKRSA